MASMSLPGIRPKWTDVVDPRFAATPHSARLAYRAVTTCSARDPRGFSSGVRASLATRAEFHRSECEADASAADHSAATGGFGARAPGAGPIAVERSPDEKRLITTGEMVCGTEP